MLSPLLQDNNNGCPDVTTREEVINNAHPKVKWNTTKMTKRYTTKVPKRDTIKVPKEGHSKGDKEKHPKGEIKAISSDLEKATTLCFPPLKIDHPFQLRLYFIASVYALIVVVGVVYATSSSSVGSRRYDRSVL